MHEMAPSFLHFVGVDGVIYYFFSIYIGVEINIAEILDVKQQWRILLYASCTLVGRISIEGLGRNGSPKLDVNPCMRERNERIQPKPTPEKHQHF